MEINDKQIFYPFEDKNYPIDSLGYVLNKFYTKDKKYIKNAKVKNHRFTFIGFDRSAPIATTKKTFESKAEALKKCKQNVSGKVFDSKINQILPNANVALYKDLELLESVIVSNNGEYKFEDLECNSNYKVVANKDEYNGNEQKFLTTSKHNKDNVVDLNLMPMKVNRITDEIDQCQQALNEVGTIYFDLDKDYIRPDAAEKLEEVVRIMMECKHIVIMATAHTDSRGTDKYNLELSQRRAQSMVNYIVKRGVERSRVYAMGYGETQLLNKCGNLVKCTEEDHSVNRRTEFKIIK